MALAAAMSRHAWRRAPSLPGWGTMRRWVLDKREPPRGGHVAETAVKTGESHFSRGIELYCPWKVSRHRAKAFLNLLRAVSGSNWDISNATAI